MSSLLSIPISKAAYFQLPNNFAHLIESDTEYLRLFTCTTRTEKVKRHKHSCGGTLRKPVPSTAHQPTYTHIQQHAIQYYSLYLDLILGSEWQEEIERT